jgi:leader peptidase (prepilin peptidase)/N-methyltransferase
MTSIDLLTQTPVLLYSVIFVFALAMGSFLNVVIHRLPIILEARWRHECAEAFDDKRPREGPPGMTLARPGSQCPRCGHNLRITENIPVLSYLFLRGRCSACGAKISPRYPLVEVATAAFSVLVVWRFGLSWDAAAALILTWALIALAAIDLDTQLLPDAITLPVLWLGLLISLDGWFTDSQSAILGATLGYLSLWSVFHLFRLATGKEGMGYGDFKLFALFGAWLGWQHLPQVLLLSALTGAIVGIFLVVVRGHDRQIPIPFGPYLTAAGWISLMWGDGISRAYMHWSGLA